MDDEPDILTLLQGMLSGGGYQLHATTEHGRALDWLERAPAFRLVITDLRMPGLDGFRFVDRVREICGQKSPGVIFMTGYPSCETLQRAIRAGALDVLLKPLRQHDVHESVERALRRDSVEQRLPDTLSRLQSQLEVLRSEFVNWGDPVRSWAASASDSVPASLTDRLEHWVRAQGLRLRFFDRDVAEGAPWSILVNLVLAHTKGRPEYPSSLSVAVGIPLSSTLRHIATLKELGWARETRDESDGRRRLIWCTEAAAKAMEAYLAALDE